MNRAYDAVSPIFSAPFWRLHRDEALSVGHRHWVEYRMAFEPDRRADCYHPCSEVEAIWPDVLKTVRCRREIYS
jgi:hypothetical protein